MNKLKINNNPFLLGMRVFGKASTIASASLISEKSSHSTPCKNLYRQLHKDTDFINCFSFQAFCVFLSFIQPKLSLGVFIT